MITEEGTVISPEMVMQAVYFTRKRAIKLVVCKGEAIEERKARGIIKLGISRDFNYDQLS